MILHVGEILTYAECEALIEAFRNNRHKSQEKDYSGQPVLRLHHFVEDAREEVGKCVGEVLRIASDTSQLYCETVILTCMGPGGHHAPHADNCERDGTGKWVPNHTPNRTHSAIIYLSSPMAGGELYFPHSGVSVSPVAGRMALFPSDQDHVHGVRHVEAGLRYSLAVWLTDRKECAETLL